MEFKKLPVSKLTMNTGQIEGVPANPRQWTQADLDRLAASIEETPELLDARGAIVVPHKGKFVVLGGNMRLTAAKKLGLAEMPCAVLPEDTPIETLKAVVIKDNSSMGAWDFDALANEWDDLPLADWGVPSWDADDVEEAAPQQVEEDDFNEETDEIETRCKKGDIWQLGEHRLMCGDSTNTDSMAMLMNGNKADMVFTSPPYNGDNSMPQEHIAKGVKTTSQRLYNKGYEDNLESDDYVELCSKVLDICFLYTEGFIFWNVNYNAKSRFEYISQIVPKLPYLIEQICWKKHGSIPFKGSMKRIWEPIYLFSTNGKRLGLDKCEENFWEVNNQKNNYADHNACFPVALVVMALSILPNCKYILDPFGGSGSTLIAAEQLNRRCYMMEIDPHYCDVIINRWEEFTGQKAKKIE